MGGNGMGTGCGQEGGGGGGGGDSEGASLPDRQLVHERGPPSVVGGGVD